MAERERKRNRREITSILVYHNHTLSVLSYIANDRRLRIITPAHIRPTEILEGRKGEKERERTEGGKDKEMARLSGAILQQTGLPFLQLNIFETSYRGQFLLPFLHSLSLSFSLLLSPFLSPSSPANDFLSCLTAHGEKRSRHIKTSISERGAGYQPTS